MDARGTVTAEEWGSLPPRTASYSLVAQWQSIRLITERPKVRFLSREPVLLRVMEVVIRLVS